MNDPLLVDECLSIELVPVAHELGFEAYHVAHYGLAGAPDHVVFAEVARRGFVFVTNNRDDFVDLVAKVDLHAGLIVILPRSRRDDQMRLFRIAIERVRQLGGLTNQVLEIDGAAEVRLYDLPRRGGAISGGIADATNARRPG